MFPLGDTNKLPGVAFVTYLLIALNIYVFYLELSSVNIDSLILRYALTPSQLSFSQPTSLLPLITSQFLHGGWYHILTNMWFLAVFGPNIERAWGSIRFLVSYIVAGIAAAILQILFTTEASIPILGASGAIAGVLGAYFFYFPHHRINTFVPLGFIPLIIAIPAGVILIYWFALQLAGGFFGGDSNLGGVAFFAHIGGFLAGIILAAISRNKAVFED